jgi:L-threonylcarbamoyladenylate synthase
MILYPTETIYALGVNGFDASELAKLYTLKGRDEGKPVSLLVRSIADIERYAVLSPRARRIAEAFLPGSLTLVLPAREDAPRVPVYHDGTLSFRISPDPFAKQVIDEFMAEHDAPLTCTSANVSGLPTASTPKEILEQFNNNGKDVAMITRVVDDGQRTGLPSTVVQVVGDEVIIHREGAIPADDIRGV